MDLKENVVNSVRIYDGNIISLSKETVVLPNGDSAEREIITHGGGVAVIPITEDNKIIFVKQYRTAIKELTLEIPAGKLEGNEPIEDCAKRELEEETGYSAATLIPIIKMFPSPAYTTEKDYIFVAKGLKKGKAHPDSDEFIETFEISIDKAKEMVFNNEITDAKTIIAILAADKFKY